jgi:hypothetical protein
MRNMPIPGPGSVKQIWIQTVNANTKSTDSILQLRKNNADVAGASITIPGGAAVPQRYTQTGDWAYDDLDEMCFKFSVTSSGNLYVKHWGMIVELS